MRAVWSDQARIQRYLDVEKALFYKAAVWLAGGPRHDRRGRVLHGHLVCGHLAAWRETGSNRNGSLSTTVSHKGQEATRNAHMTIEIEVHKALGSFEHHPVARSRIDPAGDSRHVLNRKER
jgi:hypothetical protein